MVWIKMPGPIVNYNVERWCGNCGEKRAKNLLNRCGFCGLALRTGKNNKKTDNRKFKSNVNNPIRSE